MKSSKKTLKTVGAFCAAVALALCAGCATTTTAPAPKCGCGKYGAAGATSTEKSMHVWRKTADSRGYLPCLCLCAHYHDARMATDANTECRGVCASCRKRPLQNGVDVDGGGTGSTGSTGNVDDIK